jgi:hypothetical protein
VGSLFTGGHLHVYIEPERCACSAVFCLLSAHLFYRKKTKAQQPTFCNSQFPRVVSKNFVFFVFGGFPVGFCMFLTGGVWIVWFLLFFLVWSGVSGKQMPQPKQIKKPKKPNNPNTSNQKHAKTQWKTTKTKTNKIFETTLGNCWFQKVGC